MRTEEIVSNAEYLKEVFSDYVGHTECKRLVNQVLASQDKDHFKSAAVISDLPNEGKSFVTLVLALGYAALLSKRVLIVDAVYQTRGGALYLGRVFGPRSVETRPRADQNGHLGPGIIDFMSTQGHDDAVLDSTDFRMGACIEELKSHYDLVLFDTCALSSAERQNMDPVVICRQADTSILVTSPWSVKSDVVERIKSDFQRWNIRLLGTIFNSGAPR